MTPEHIKANLAQWVKDEAFHTIAGACGDLLRAVETLQSAIYKLQLPENQNKFPSEYLNEAEKAVVRTAVVVNI